MVDYLDRAENEIARLHAENERLCFQREGLLCRVAELRAENERLHAKIINSGPEDDWEERGAATELRADNERQRIAIENAMFSLASSDNANDDLRAMNERLRAGIRDTLGLLSDGPGGPRRLSAIKFLEELIK